MVKNKGCCNSVATLIKYGVDAMNKFNIKLADRIISISCRYDYAIQVCRDYIDRSQNVDFSVFATDEDIETDMNNEEVRVFADYAEFICLYRKIAEQLPKYDCMVMHGASITYKDSALLFVAPSGTGKSTHIRLWKDVFDDDVDIINGDKPIVSVDDEDTTIYGTPWAGKENWHKNHKAPLNAICILKQSKHNCIKKVYPQEYLPLLLNQVYLPRDAETLKLTLELFNKLIARIPVYLLECDISQEAVMTAYNAIVENEWRFDIYEN